MKRLLAALERLPSDVEYTFLRMILDTLPPTLETAIWLNHAPTDEILTAFNEGTYGRVDRLLRQREKTVLNLSKSERDEACALLDQTRHSLAQLLLAEALAKAKAPGDCWIETRAVDPARRGRPSEPCPISGPGMVIDVWQFGRDRRMHRLLVKGIPAGLPPWGDERIPWVDPVALDKLHLSLLRKYCRPLLRLRVGHEWRTKRRRSPWRGSDAASDSPALRLPPPLLSGPPLYRGIEIGLSRQVSESSAPQHSGPYSSPSARTSLLISPRSG